LPIPPLEDQKAIAHILGTLDDKIELNRRINETLEARARALFKSWFVDFDPVRAKADGCDPPGFDAATAALFPAAFEDSPLGEIPKGWRASRILDVADNPRRGVHPEEVAPNTPYIGLEHMPRHRIALDEWGEAEGVESGKFQFHRDEILFGKLRPYFHKVGIAPVDGVCSTDILVVVPRGAAWFGFVLGHVSSDDFVAHTNAGSSGTRMPRTNWRDMGAFEVATPPEPIAAAFTAIVRPLMDRIGANIHESRTLAAIRNTLLPKLLSGEIRISTEPGMA
jgi:type I restriction enzyme S subunit